MNAMVAIAELGVEHPVQFLLDTGADRTCLHYPDVLMAGINPFRLRGFPKKSMNGIGGSADYFVVPADIKLFDSDQGYIVHRISLRIADISQLKAGDIPSLLGRDVFNQYQMYYDPRRSRVRLRPS